MQSKGHYRLTVRQGPTPGRAIELAKEVLTLGRDVNNDVVINDAEVSRTHARLTAQADGYLVEDLASTNGTFMNGQRITGPKLLRSGDMLGLGETVVLEMGMARDADATLTAGLATESPSSTEPPFVPSGPSPSAGSFGSAPAGEPSVYAPPTPPRRDNRMLYLGITCGCLTVCLGLALLFGFIFAYSNGAFCDFSTALCPINF